MSKLNFLEIQDWKAAHLCWISDRKSFVPKDFVGFTESYFDIMEQIYSNKACSQMYAKRCYLADLKWLEDKTKMNYQLKKELDIKHQHFITIGFNHQTWSIDKCVAVIEKIMSFSWILKGRAVFELHRSNGEHPHCHFLIECLEPKSKILEKLWATKGLKKVVLSKSFIDYKEVNHNHSNYIMGIKQEDKMPFVEKDKEWREANNIKEYWEK